MLNVIDNNVDFKNEKENQIEFWNIYKNYYEYKTDDLIICPSFFEKNKELFIS